MQRLWMTHSHMYPGQLSLLSSEESKVSSSLLWLCWLCICDIPSEHILKRILYGQLLHGSCNASSQWRLPQEVRAYSITLQSLNSILLPMSPWHQLCKKSCQSSSNNPSMQQNCIVKGAYYIAGKTRPASDCTNTFILHLGLQSHEQWQRVVKWDWKLSGWLTTLLQCFDTAGWVFRPVKISSLTWPLQCRATLNLTQPVRVRIRVSEW